MKQKRTESIYNINTEKVIRFKLPADSVAMTFGASLKPEFNGGLYL